MCVISLLFVPTRSTGQMESFSQFLLDLRHSHEWLARHWCPPQTAELLVPPLSTLTITYLTKHNRDDVYMYIAYIYMPVVYLLPHPDMTGISSWWQKVAKMHIYRGKPMQMAKARPLPSLTVQGTHSWLHAKSLQGSRSCSCDANDRLEAVDWNGFWIQPWGFGDNIFFILLDEQSSF